MTPYYEDDLVTLYHGDCREVLPGLQVSPDVLLSDPPYGIDYRTIRGGSLIASDRNEASAFEVVRSALDSIGPVPVAYLFCDWRSVHTMSDALAVAGMPPKACIVWDKGHGVQNLDRFAKSYELIVYAGPYGGERTRDSDVWQSPRDYKPDHPTPKPVSLLIRALDYANATPGQLVVDPFMGSGSSIRAAKDLGCKAIGIEIDERYCEIAARRLGQEVLDFGAAS